VVRYLKRRGAPTADQLSPEHLRVQNGGEKLKVILLYRKRKLPARANRHVSPLGDLAGVWPGILGDVWSLAREGARKRRATNKHHVTKEGDPTTPVGKKDQVRDKKNSFRSPPGDKTGSKLVIEEGTGGTRSESAGDSVKSTPG